MSLTENRYARMAVAALLAALAMALILAIPSHAHADSRAYGSLCSKYESDNNPGDVDPDGVYGAYQMDTYNAYQFAKWLKAGADKPTTNGSRSMLVKWGTNLVAGYVKDKNKCGTYFNKAWKAANAEHTDLFFTIQYQYCIKSYYNSAVKIWQSKASGFDPNDYSIGLRSALFSVAIQHGPTGSGYVWSHVITTIGGWQKGMAEDVLINAIYDERSRLNTKTGELAYFPGCGRYDDKKTAGYGLYQRLHVNERKDALALMKKYGGYCSHSSKSGGATSYTVVSETTHKLKTTAVKCASCGAVLKASSSSTCSHSFEYNGKYRKCDCGQKYIVHTKSKYYKAKVALNVRSSASPKARVKTTLPKGKILKALKAKKGTDGNWWIKVKYNGVSGYVRAHYMSYHGIASSGHKYSGDKCKYCGATKSAVANNTTAGTYASAADVYSFSAAYSTSSKVDLITAGSKITVTSVVKNRYNDLWGKTPQGTYVKLKALVRV